MRDLDNITVIIDVLINKNKAVKFQDILAEVAMDKSEVLSILKILTDFDLVKKDLISEDNKNFIYSIKKDITAIHITRFADLGIDLIAFGFFNITKKEKTAALELSTKIKEVQKITENQRKLIPHNKILNQLNIDDISSHLLLIYEATNHQLFEYLEELAKKDTKMKQMMDLYEQSYQSLKSYLEMNKKI